VFAQTKSEGLRKDGISCGVNKNIEIDERERCMRKQIVSRVEHSKACYGWEVMRHKQRVSRGASSGEEHQAAYINMNTKVQERQTYLRKQRVVGGEYSKPCSGEQFLCSET
jgi:hypothetical protein